MSETEFDSPWKEAIEEFFEPFMALLFPDAHAEIDWSRGFEMLDKELQALSVGGDGGTRFVDKLVKVWRLDGGEQWLLIHIEVQSQPDADFEARMFQYHIRIYDRYPGRAVVSLAVLGDDRPAWRPGRFGYNLWGCSVEFRFPAVKLLDLAADASRLESDPNPFTAVVLAHLEAMQTRRDDGRRKASKRRVALGLYRRGWDQQRVRRVFRFVDWLMRLPLELDRDVWEEMRAFEQENQMPYVTSVERFGIEKGRAEGLERAVELTLVAKFGEEGLALLPEIRRDGSPELFEALLLKISRASNLEELRALVAAQDHPSGRKV